MRQVKGKGKAAELIEERGSSGSKMRMSSHCKTTEQEQRLNGQPVLLHLPL